MSASLVGSEMCIRDRSRRLWCRLGVRLPGPRPKAPGCWGLTPSRAPHLCLLYTSDAADDM
eukprot:10163752-Alexandrium_andersonii.AAC.1